MSGKKNTSLDRVLGRLDALDSINLANLVQRLARERRLFEGIFDTLREGIVVIGADGVIAYANAAADRLIGVGGAERDRQTLWRLLPGLHGSLAASLSPGPAGRARAKAEPPMVAREIDLTYPEPRTVRVQLIPFRDDGPEAEQRFAVILTDVTNDKASTERRIEAERTSSILLLAAGVAHELGNPLNSLNIHLQLIERKLRKTKGAAGTEALGESVQVCREEVRRLDGIISNFLEAIRPRRPDLAETSLAEVLAEVLRFQRREFADREVAVEVEIPATLPAVMADRNQLKQVFFNLTKNALEAMGPGGRLKIKSRADDGSVYLLFGDSGAGIKPEDFGRLFQPYHTTKAGGHGLGLMIVQRIMREHGGHAGIESKAGVGTVVTLQFPRKDRQVRLLSS